MDASPLTLVKALVPKLPLLTKTALSHTLGLSEPSGKWDLQTALTVNVIRALILDTPPASISKVQRWSLKAPAIKGKIWVSNTTMSVPAEDDIRQALFKAIEAMKEPGAPEGDFAQPEMVPVEAEWTGYLGGATQKSEELRASEEEKYKEMMKEVTSLATILYFHGGGYYLLDPASHRPVCQNLAKRTKGRCLSVRYRLAPQAAFPTQLLDALVSYFTLLYPPQGSFHTPVSPEHIVFAGDSAGGNLALALLQTLLEFRRRNLTITWNGEAREIPLPAGVATSSPWIDVTHSSPSCFANRDYDYLPSRKDVPETGPLYTPCSIWPSNPPRKIIFAPDDLLTHPLVSPILVKSWEGAPPMYMATGRELLTDEDRYVSQKAASQGVTVVYEEYEAMPHCFAMILEHIPATSFFYDRWAGFIASVTDEVKREGVKTSGKIILAKSLKEKEVDVTQLTEFTDEEVLERMKTTASKMSIKQPDPLAKL